MATEKTPAGNDGIIEVNGLRCVERDGEYWVPGPEIGRLLGYGEPQKQINKLFQRHVQSLQEHTTIVNMGMEVGARNIRVFDEIGTYYLCMKAETSKANEVSLQFARALKELRRQKLMDAQSELALQKTRRVEAVKTAITLPAGVRDSITDVVRYRLVGLETWEIGKIMDMGAHAVRRVVAVAEELELLPKTGPRLPARTVRRLTPQEKEKILELRRQGLSISKIGREMGRGKETVRCFIRNSEYREGRTNA